MQLFLWATVFGGLCTAQFKGPSDPRRFKYYSPPTRGAGPCDIATGPDGENIWYQDYEANVVGVLFTNTTKTVKISEFPMPAQVEKRRNLYTGELCSMVLGHDGYIYGSTRNVDQIIKVTAKGPNLGHIETIWPQPTITSPVWDFNYGWAGPTGVFWSQTAFNLITFLPYGSKNYEYYELATPGSGPSGLRIAADGALWFTTFMNQQIGRLNHTSRQMTTWPLTPPQGLAPGSMQTQTQGRYLWANAHGTNGLIRIDIKNPKAFKYIPGGPQNPVQNAGDPIGNVWVSSFVDDVLAYYSPSKGTWTTVTPPGSASGNSSHTKQTLPIHHGPLNSMWFTNLKTGQIGQYMLNKHA